MLFLPFSYSYDLSHSLQYNLTPPKEIRPTFEGVPQDGEFRNVGRQSVLGVKAHPNYKFVWNSFLLKPVESVFHSDWILFVIHGFVGQSNISLYGKSLYLTLIARRSNKFAGTRFLKRGANYEVRSAIVSSDKKVSGKNNSKNRAMSRMKWKLSRLSMTRPSVVSHKGGILPTSSYEDPCPRIGAKMFPRWSLSLLFRSTCLMHSHKRLVILLAVL